MSGKYQQLADSIVESVGGAANVASVIHCQTRLRFSLRDESLVDQKRLVATDGVATAMSEQAVAANHVARAVEDMRRQSAQVSQAVAEQGRVTKGMAAAAEFVSKQMALITRANREHTAAAETILTSLREIRAVIHPVPGKVVCQPPEAKWAPRDEYDAKFSLPYTVAAALVRGQFGLAELEDDALADSAIRELAQKVRVDDDPDSAFPAAYSGAIEIELDDGRTLRHREQVNRGHEDRPLTNDEIVAKYRETIGRVAPDATADRVQNAVLALGDGTPASDFAEACRG